MPRFNMGETVKYKPVGGMLPCITNFRGLANICLLVGPESHTSESTGVVTDVLTEPGIQADRNVNASQDNPRYEVSRTSFILCPKLYLTDIIQI